MIYWEYQAVLITEPELLELYHIITDVLYLDPIPIYKLVVANDDVVVHYQILEKVICLFPDFYEQSVAGKIQTVIYELRHHMQWTKQLEIS